MAKPRTKFEHAWQLMKEGVRVLEDFPIDHTAMRVPETPEMTVLRKQIEDLQTQYAAIKVAEQMRYWKTFVHIAKTGPLSK